MAKKVKKVMSPKDFTSSIIRLFSDCYNYGVMEADRIRDDSLLEEMSMKSKEHGIYCMLSSAHDMDSREWLVNILLINNKTSGFQKCFDLLTRYLNVYNYMRCVLPLCHDFYLMGASDYFKYPNIVDLETLKQPRILKWTNGGLVSSSKRELILNAQKFCFERERVLDNEDYKNYESIKQYHFNVFIQELWQSLVKVDEY